jgi:hypothetical protein
MNKSCDNCSRELAKFSFFSPDKKIYMYNNAVLCSDCFRKISAREQLEEA